jgi:gliding motility-associated-like protein
MRCIALNFNNVIKKVGESVWIRIEKACTKKFKTNPVTTSFVKKNLLLLKSVLYCVMLFYTHISFATITIQSINTTTSTCGNNGTATVSAVSDKSNPALFYEIISGPYVSTIQSISVFSSLFPGTYTVRVYDVDFQYKDQVFTIAGNYTLPDLNLQITHPFCSGSSTGKITAVAMAGKGRSPFTWELVSSGSTTPQTTNVFNNLPAGTYNLKLTDACGNYQTRTAILLDRGTGLSHASDGIPTITKIGCDTMLYSMEIRIIKERAKDPVTFTYTKGDGNVITKTVRPIPVDTVNSIPALYVIRDTIPDITYKNYIHGCIKDICGYEICSARDSVAPFNFDLKYNTVYTSCSYNLTGSAAYKSIAGTPYMRTSFRAPLSLTLRDTGTNQLIDSTGCNRNFCNLAFKNGVPGNTYQVRITDGCSQTFEQNFQWPEPVTNPASVNVSIGKGCMDSTSVATFGLSNFGAPVTIQILSGPAQSFSERPAYAFSYPITYPKTFFANLNSQYSIKNFPAGTYEYVVTDTCGTAINGTFVIQPSNLNILSYSYSVTKACAGNNTLKFNPVNTVATGILITDISTNTDLYKRTGSVIRDSLTSLKAGQYLLKITYGNSTNVSITDGFNDCRTTTDTITIADHSSNTDIQSHRSILCNNINYVEINTDSSQGLAPYQYEISSGPITSPLQNSNVFQLPTYGDYTIRIRDACGNSNIRQISVDSSTFAPILKVGASCRGNKIVLKAINSSFFEYDWIRPDGTTYTGDSLIIPVLSSADTGVYQITKKVSINNCTDEFKSSYHLQLRDVHRQTISFCEGSSVSIGTRIFTTSGIYTDTLKSYEGCDSIRIITLNMLSKKIDTINVRICNGANISIGGNTYNQPGIYKDSIQNTFGCYEITATKLEVNGFPDTIQTSICEGQVYSMANHTYSLPGFYTDTLLSSFGCDSVIITELIVVPLKRTQLIQSICTGQSITIGIHTYTRTGVYNDTLSTATCDSIITLYLTVHQPFEILPVHDTTHCFDEGPLTLTANPAQFYLWMPSGETTQHIEISQAGTYRVTATDIHLCSYTEEITTNEFCETKLFVPTGFTPNGDGLHDDVEIFGKHFTDFKITIFNRWGEIIFISTDKDIRWDGTYKGEAMPAGSYPWIITYKSTLDPENAEHALKGTITLVR